MQFLIPLKNAVPQLLDLTGRHGQRLKKWTRHWWLKQYPLVKPHRGLLQCHCQCSQGGIYTQCFIVVKGDWVEYKWSSLVFYCFFTIRTLWVFLFLFDFFFCISRCQFYLSRERCALVRLKYTSQWYFSFLYNYM